jgi:hypothetical protein
LLTTPSDLPDKRPELSLYAIENYYVGPCRLRRFTLRVDGFVSVNAPYSGGEMMTVPLRFQGRVVRWKKSTDVKRTGRQYTAASGVTQRRGSLLVSIQIGFGDE